ncbi:MAG: hypothetical protein M3Y77_13095 [Actinomycetota bacterium]|nr:hypothetical protein [Actinomycetota bacterium]
MDTGTLEISRLALLAPRNSMAAMETSTAACSARCSSPATVPCRSRSALPGWSSSLHRDLGLQVWSGGLDGATSLAFIGRKAHTLIVCRPGRGWLPTGRPAETHPAEITLTGAPDARRPAADLRPMPYLVNTSSAP